jgi:hypothetical protein
LVQEHGMEPTLGVGDLILIDHALRDPFEGFIYLIRYKNGMSQIEATQNSRSEHFERSQQQSRIRSNHFSTNRAWQIRGNRRSSGLGRPRSKPARLSVCLLARESTVARSVSQTSSPADDIACRRSIKTSQTPL